MVKIMSYYIRGKGAYRATGDINRWLKIRSIEKDGNRVAIKFKLAGEYKYLSLTYGTQQHIEFGKGKWPKVTKIDWINILMENKYV